jgi:glutamyl-tRNA synthetase
MVLSVAIDDHLMGVTHVLNGKDHADNAKKETIIINYLGWKEPIYKHWGRINFVGLTLSTTKTKLAIEEKKYTGWDDIRLPFLQSLRKRGYQPQALRRFALETGLSLNDKTVTVEEFWKMINSFNKEIVDPLANRYFVIKEPIKIVIKNLKKETKFLLHPDYPERGERNFIVNENIYLEKEDYDNLEKDKVHRLMDLCNVILENNEFKLVSEDYESYKNAQNKGKIIHWLPENDYLKINLKFPDNQIIECLGEKSLDNVQDNEIVQFERLAFAKKNGNCFWYLHK